MTRPEQIERYQVVDTIGQGGFAIVYLAVDPRLKRQVALKLLRQADWDTAVTPSASSTPKTARERFQREAQILVNLEFDGIVRIYDYGEFAGRPFLVMHYMPGGTLADRLSGKPLSLAETAVILNRLCTALDRVHQRGTIHRDLKPHNILFDAEGEANLSDFGIARLTESTSSTLGSIGTPRYMAPEQFKDEAISNQTDIYQMGVILFEMLTGNTPYNAPSYHAIMNKVLNDDIPSAHRHNPAVDKAFDDIIRIAMAKEAADRYQTATQLAQHFEALLNHRPLPPGLPPVPPLLSPEKEPPQTAGSRTKIAWVLTAVLLIPLLLVAILLIRRALPDKEEAAVKIPAAEQEQQNVSIVLVTATAVPGSEALTTSESNPAEPDNALQATQTSEAMVVTAQNLAATQTALASPEQPAPTSTPSATPRPTRIAALSSQDTLAIRIEEPIFVDGNLAEWPAVVPLISEHIVYQDESWDGSEDLVLIWQLAWDDIYLYLGITAVDDIHVQTETGNQVYKGDSVSLQIDTDRAGDLSAQVSPDDFQIDISPGNFDNIPPSAHRFRGNNDDWMDNAPGHTIFVQARQTSDGYTMEVAIPWADLDMTPVGGETLGLALNATDNDQPGTAVQELFISNVPDRQFNTPNSWGTLTLQGGSVTINQPQPTATPLPPAGRMVEDFEVSHIDILEGEYWINSPGNEITLQLAGPPHVFLGQQALAVTYQFRRDFNDYVGIERNLAAPLDWSGYSAICFWLDNPDFEGFIIFQFKELGSEAWKYQAPLQPGTVGEICLALNDDVFAIDSEKLNNIMDLTAVDNYAIYLGEGGVTAGTVYIDAIQLKP